MKLGVAVVLATSLAFTPTAHAAFRVGIAADYSYTMSKEDATALGATYERYTMFWRKGQNQFEGTLRFTPGVTPYVLVMGSQENVPTTPQELANYCRFIDSILTKYPEVKDVGIWGEPSQYNNYTWPKGLPMSYYGTMLRTCGPIIHAHKARMIGPQAHPMPPQAMQDVINVLKGTGLDVFSLDPYWYYGWMKIYVQQVHNTLGRIPIWVAEDGIDTVPPPEYTYMYTPGSQWSYVTTWQGQADTVATHMLYSYCAGVSVWLNFLMQDEPQLERWQSGLKAPNGMHKPAYDAFANTYRSISAYKCPVDLPVPPKPPPPTYFADKPHKGQTGRFYS